MPQTRPRGGRGALLLLPPEEASTQFLSPSPRKGRRRNKLGPCEASSPLHPHRSRGPGKHREALLRMKKGTRKMSATVRADIYQTITDRIVAAIEAGAGDWKM